MAAIIIGDVVGIIQSLNNDSLISQWGWWLVLVVILTVSPFIAFHKLRLRLVENQKQVDELQNEKDKITTVDGFLGEGNHILSILTTKSLDAIDRYDWRMNGLLMLEIF